MENLSRNEWLVLSSLSDDWECLSSIEKPEVSRADMVELLEELYGKGLICVEKGLPFDRKILLEEPNEHWDTIYWFGLTENGCDAWEKYSQKYSEYPVDWSSSWKGSFWSDERGGYIEGVSEDVCKQALKSQLKNVPFTIDKNSIEHKNIEGFQAKYYKFIPSGHRIDFKLKRSICKTVWFGLLKIFGKK
jgi:hypothetical protein